MHPRIALAALAAAVLAAVAFGVPGLLGDRTPDAAPAAEENAGTAAPKPEPIAPAAAAAPATSAPDSAPPPPLATKPTVVRMPDGTTMPTLNGIAENVTLPWPQGRPYSPVVETKTERGQQWYVHGDGCISTMVRTFDDAAGIWRTAVQVFEPIPVAPTILRGNS